MPDIDDLLDRVQDISPALKALGTALVGRFMTAFEDQRGGGVSWLPRGKVNVAGIVADLNAGKRPPARRFQTRPALRDTDNLMGSLDSRVRGGSLEVGSSLSYASVHQRGGESKVKLERSSRKGLYQLLKREPGLRDKLGWLFSKPEFTVKVPARPFLFFGREEGELFHEVLKDFIRGK